MKRNLLRLTAGGAVFAAAAWLALPEAVGYQTFGQSLSLNQRDLRVYNNFNGSAANNNTAAHPNWPGYDGAELAMWKGAAEWGARSHGDGSGDTTQSNVGDGAANFNYAWNGNASGVGSTNDNIISSIGGSSGGVLAYAELPINNGWRIRFYGDAWNWQDGPGNVSSGLDMQGVAAHELGHTLGLDHTNVGGSTMTAFVSGSGVSQRSIGSDDIAGVRAIYGVRNDQQMPRIDNVTGGTAPGSVVTVTGGNFDATGNRIWLNSATLNGGNSGGEMLKVNGVSSSGGGTTLSFTLPSGGFESGSLHVQSSGNGFDSLGESHPVDFSGPAVDTVSLSVSDLFPDVGDSINFQIVSNHPVAPYILHYSFQNSGTTINGQPFDIGTPRGAVGSGTTNLFGFASFNRTVPAAAAGRIIFMEAQVDAGGGTFDSNMATMIVF